MNLHRFKPLFAKRRTFTPSGPALIQLIQAVHEKGAAFRFRARGFSMSPSVRDGDRIIIEPMAGAAPDIGDITAFTQPETGKLTVHRVIGKKGNSYLLKGDNVQEDDGYVPEKNILGRVKVIERSAWKIIFSYLLRPVRMLLLRIRGGKTP